MSFGKLKPVKVSKEDAIKIASSTMNQSFGSGVPMLMDNNYSIFKADLLGRHLLYIPRNNPEQFIEEFGMLVEPTNTIGVKLNGSQFMTELRAVTEDIVTKSLIEQGVSGNSPLVELANKASELRNLIKERKAYENNIPLENFQNIDYSKTTAESQIMQSINESIPVRYAKLSYVYPVVEIKLDSSKRGLNVKKDEDGNLITSVHWVISSKNQFDKLLKSMNQFEEGEQIAGHFFIYDYSSSTINPESKNARRDAGRDMTISVASNEALDKLRDALDKQAEGWDLEAIKNSVTCAAFIPDDALRDVTAPVSNFLDSRIKTENELALVRSNEESTPNQLEGGEELKKLESKDAESVVSNFEIEEDDDFSL